MNTESEIKAERRRVTARDVGDILISNHRFVDQLNLRPTCRAANRDRNVHQRRDHEPERSDGEDKMMLLNRERDEHPGMRVEPENEILAARIEELCASGDKKSIKMNSRLTERGKIRRALQAQKKIQKENDKLQVSVPEKFGENLEANVKHLNNESSRADTVNVFTTGHKTTSKPLKKHALKGKRLDVKHKADNLLTYQLEQTKWSEEQLDSLFLARESHDSRTDDEFEDMSHSKKSEEEIAAMFLATADPSGNWYTGLTEQELKNMEKAKKSSEKIARLIEKTERQKANKAEKKPKEAKRKEEKENKAAAKAIKKKEIVTNTMDTSESDDSPSDDFDDLVYSTKSEEEITAMFLATTDSSEDWKTGLPEKELKRIEKARKRSDKIARQFEKNERKKAKKADKKAHEAAFMDELMADIAEMKAKQEGVFEKESVEQNKEKQTSESAASTSDDFDETRYSKKSDEEIAAMFLATTDPSEVCDTGLSEKELKHIKKARKSSDKIARQIAKNESKKANKAKKTEKEAKKESEKERKRLEKQAAAEEKALRNGSKKAKYGVF